MHFHANSTHKLTAVTVRVGLSIKVGLQAHIYCRFVVSVVDEKRKRGGKRRGERGVEGISSQYKKFEHNLNTRSSKCSRRLELNARPGK